MTRQNTLAYYLSYFGNRDPAVTAVIKRLQEKPGLGGVNPNCVSWISETGLAFRISSYNDLALYAQHEQTELEARDFKMAPYGVQWTRDSVKSRLLMMRGVFVKDEVVLIYHGGDPADSVFKLNSEFRD